MNRAAAKLIGAKRYIESPCPAHGPKAERYTTSKNCVACDREYKIRKRKEASAERELPVFHIVQKIEFQVPNSQKARKSVLHAPRRTGMSK